jgi:hypothetical protein
VNRTFLECYRCPETFAGFSTGVATSDEAGFFRFGKDAVCYGALSSGFTARDIRSKLYDALRDVASEGASLRLPFDPAEITENLRTERYLRDSPHRHRTIFPERAFSAAYRMLRPALPFAVRKHLQRLYLRDWDSLPFPRWPVDRTIEHINALLLTLVLRTGAVDRIPFIWFWPDGAPSCATLTHDVETLAGRNFCETLMDLDDGVGIKSSFQIVPEQRYPVPASFLEGIRRRGFEINVHDINHDGQLFASRGAFLDRAERINRYARDFGALGFRSGTLYRRPEWFDALDFVYDMSIPNLAHLEPQRGGCCTVLPFFIGNILELPLTTTQDYSLFHILQTYSLDIWKRQIALITEKHGLVSLLVHPDYVIEERARDAYRALLGHLATLRDDGMLWIAPPGEVARWWRERSRMRIAGDRNGWRIEGPGRERARLAFASLVDGTLTFTIEKTHAS